MIGEDEEDRQYYFIAQHVKFHNTTMGNICVAQKLLLSPLCSFGTTHAQIVLKFATVATTRGRDNPSYALTDLQLPPLDHGNEFTSEPRWQ